MCNDTAPDLYSVYFIALNKLKPRPLACLETGRTCSYGQGGRGQQWILLGEGLATVCKVYLIEPAIITLQIFRLGVLPAFDSFPRITEPDFARSHNHDHVAQMMERALKEIVRRPVNGRPNN